MNTILQYLSSDLAAGTGEYRRADFAGNPLSPDEIYDSFQDWISSRGMELYPAQDEALLEIAQDANLIVSTPTGSGKSTVAVAAHFASLARGQRSYYTAPIKALVSEKFFDLVEIFGAQNVGMMTGDSSINPGAPLICCTAEILANIALRQGPGADLLHVVMDEFHFYSDPQRGWAWQTPLLELPQARFVLMSATLGDTSRFEEGISELTGHPTALISSSTRPIPLHFYYSSTPVQETITELVQTKQSPVYLVYFSQLQAIEAATALMSLKIASSDDRERIAAMTQNFRFSAGFGKVLQRLVKNGIGVHHAGMLPKYRRLVEQLAQAGLLKVICGTDTLGVGINVPIRTVLLTALSKFDGQRTRRLKAREFHQIAGRAGRAGFDTAGTVVVQAPEHEIENQRLEQKAHAKFGGDQKKIAQSLRSKRKKAPEGFVSWSRSTFEQLVQAKPEALTSSFDVSHAMILNILQREQDEFKVAHHLLSSCHQPRAKKYQLMRKAIGIYRELVAAGVVQKFAEPDEAGRRVGLTVQLQDNFALNQPLSPFALAAIELLDPEDASYGLDLLSILESTLENPRQVLRMVEKKTKAEALARMKAEGMDYSERMNELDKVTYPQPLAELLEEAFASYRRAAPWVGQFELEPKSIVRDMYERAMDFSSYVQFYSLERSEGILLRYLSDAYKALRQTVPVSALREQLVDLMEWLGELVRQTDSSLLDEWERLGSDGPSQQDSAEPTGPVSAPVLTDNRRALRVMVRNALFRRVELFAREDERALAELDAGCGWDRDRWAAAMDEYFDEYDDIYTDAQARSPQLVSIDEDSGSHPGFWLVRQTFSDPLDHHDFGIEALLDLQASNEQGAVVLIVKAVGPLELSR